MVLIKKTKLVIIPLLILTLFLILINTTNTTAKYCYQESVNISNQAGTDTSGCGLIYTGNYTYGGNWANQNNLTDGNYTSGTRAVPGDAYLDLTYVLPNDTDISTSFWQVKDNATIYNVSVSQCRYNTTILIGLWCKSSNFCSWVCANNSGQSTTLRINTNSDTAFEEGMYWSVNVTTYNVTINAYEKFTDNLIDATNTYRINGSIVNKTNNLLSSGFYNFSFNNDSYKNTDLIQEISGSTQVNIMNVSNTNFTINILDNDTKINITGVTISISYDDITETIITSTNLTTFNLTQNLTYTLSVSKTGYKTISTTFTPTNQSYPYTLNITPSNKVYITIRDDETSLVIPQLIYVYFQSNTQLFNYSTTTGYLNATNVTSDNYTLSFITANGNYTTRSYQATIDEDTSPSITARLLKNTSSTDIGIYTKTETYSTLSNVLITVQKQYNGGSYATVQQAISDVNGFALLKVQVATDYKIILSSDDYATKEFNIVFYSANSPYTWLLTASADSPYNNYLNGISYYYTPENTNQNNTNINFSITVFNASYTINWVSVNTDGTTVNVSGSPGGATASNSVSLNNFTGVYPVIYSFNYIDPIDNEAYTITIPKNYYINAYSFYNTTIIDSLTDFKNEAESSDEATGGVWIAIIAVFMTIVAVITAIQLSGNQIAGVVAGFGVSIFFAISGWLSVEMIAAQIMIVFVLLMIQR